MREPFFISDGRPLCDRPCDGGLAGAVGLAEVDDGPAGVELLGGAGVAAVAAGEGEASEDVDTVVPEGADVGEVTARRAPAAPGWPANALRSP